MPMAVAVKSTAHFTARNFRCAKPANNASRSASARAGRPEPIAENVDTSSSAPPCSGTGPTNTLNPPRRGSTGRIADRATTSAAPRRVAAHASAATESQLDPGTVDSVAASTASRPPVTPHNVVAFVSARCISTSISAAASPSRRQPVQSAGVNPRPCQPRRSSIGASVLHRLVLLHTVQESRRGLGTLQCITHAEPVTVRLRPCARPDARPLTGPAVSTPAPSPRAPCPPPRA